MKDTGTRGKLELEIQSSVFIMSGLSSNYTEASRRQFDTYLWSDKKVLDNFHVHACCPQELTEAWS